jgi:outer membrane protein assembly factor BamB
VEPSGTAVVAVDRRTSPPSGGAETTKRPSPPRELTTSNITVEERLDPLPVEPFTKRKGATLQPKWSANVGLLTFKSTMIASGGRVVVGTHGRSSGGLDEASDGVYVLEGASGKVLQKIAVPGKGDLDVGGVAMDGETIFFTTDLGLVVAAGTDGVVKWSTKVASAGAQNAPPTGPNRVGAAAAAPASASTKLRPAPALARTRSVEALEVVVGDEAGKLTVLDAKTGTILWSMDTGQNEYGARGFVASAAIADVDGDGRDDIVAGARDGALVAYRGTDGKPFWRATGQSGIHASPSILDVGGDGKLEVIGAWSYSTVAVFDLATGKQKWGASLNLPAGGIEGLFSSPVPVAGPTRGSGFIAIGSSWWGAEDGVTLVGSRRALRHAEGRTTSSAVVTDLDDDGVLEAIFVTEAGAVVSVDTQGRRAELAKVAAKAEATPLVADVDANGTFELLVVGGDGVLRCFETEQDHATGVALPWGEPAEPGRSHPPRALGRVFKAGSPGIVPVPVPVRARARSGIAAMTWGATKSRPTMAATPTPTPTHRLRCVARSRRRSSSSTSIDTTSGSRRSSRAPAPHGQSLASGPGRAHSEHTKGSFIRARLARPARSHNTRAATLVLTDTCSRPGYPAGSRASRRGARRPSSSARTLPNRATSATSRCRCRSSSRSAGSRSPRVGSTASAA